MPGSRVRAATPEDVPRIQSLYESGLPKDKIIGVRYLEADWPLYCADPRAVLLVADDPSGSLAGFLLGFDCVNWCYVDVFMVSIALRGRGYGGRFLDYLDRERVARRWATIELCVAPEEEDLRGYFLRRGFARRGLSEWLIVGDR